MKNKYSSAERLFDSLGSIDDRFIAEAQSFRRTRRASHTSHTAGQRPRRWTLAAAVAALLVISLCVLPPALRTNMNTPTDGAPHATAPTDENLPYYTPSDGVISDVRVSAVTTLLREISASHSPLDGQLDLCDGRTRLVWRCDGRLYAVSLNSAELAELISALSADGDIEAPIEHSEQLWLCLGDGRVISPELRPGAGNIAIGTLFDYSAELELSESVIRCLGSILKA